MPQVIPVIALQISALAANAAVALGGSLATVHTVGAIAYSAASIGVPLAAGLLATSALTPGVPKQTVQTPINQPVASRVSGFGECRLSGVRALFETSGEKAVDVLALHDGKINAFTGYYLNDDLVTLSGGYVVSPDGKKYSGGDRCKILTRLGEDTETAFAEVTALFPGVWSSTHRGDGVASVAMICRQATKKHQLDRWPNGVPLLSVSAELQLVYDPRDVVQIQGDKSTYVYSDNPILCLLAYLTDASGGMGLDYPTRISPAVADWIAAADLCDATVTLSDASTETRYRCAGVYRHDNPPSDVIAQLLSTCDGWLALRGDGAFTVRAGLYADPTVTILDKHVVAETVRYFIGDEEAVNEIAVSFTNPATGFQEDEAGTPLRNAADIAARGVVRSQKLDLSWVPSATQARRLGERQLTRHSARLRGTTRTNLYGLNALGERYLQRTSTENAALADVVVEVIKVTIDLQGLAVTFDWIEADAAIDASDDGQDPAPTPVARPTAPALVAPTITGIVGVYDPAGSVDTGARLEVTVDSPLAQDVEWVLRWRKTGDTDWHEAPYSDIADGAAVVLLSGFVPASTGLDVEAAYVTAGGQSPWSATFTFTTAAPTTAFDAAVAAAIAAAGGGGGGAAVTVTASENLAAGDAVSFWNSSGAKVRRADATDDTKQVDGFVKVAVTSGNPATVYLPGGVNDALTGLTPGAIYFLSTTPGALTVTPPTTGGQWLQEVGKAADATHLVFAPKTGSLLA